jgi:hypothetical protein
MILLLLLISSAMAQESSPQESPARGWEKPLRTLRVYDWKDLKVQQELPADGLITTEETSALEISNTNPYTGLNPLHPLFISLLKITNSSVLEKTDFVSCEAKYEGVAPGGLTLIYHLPPLSPGGDESTNRYRALRSTGIGSFIGSRLDAMSTVDFQRR